MKALFTSFPASDYARSREFYETAIGLPVAREDDTAALRWTNYDLGGMHLKVYEWLEPYHGSGHSGLFIATAELDKAVARVRTFGCKATTPVVHPWGGRSSSVTDPFGNIFDLIDETQLGNW